MYYVRMYVSTYVYMYVCIYICCATRVVLDGLPLNQALGYPGTWWGNDVTYKSHPGHRLCRRNSMLYSSPD